MNAFLTITRKELRDFRLSPAAYVFVVVFLMLAFWMFFANFFVTGQASLAGLMSWIPILFLVFIPVITMGQWAEEKKTGTLETLLTLPIPETTIIFGKFAAALGLVAVTLGLTLPLPFLVSGLGPLDRGPVIGAYLGLLFLGASCISVGLFFSSITANPIVSFILSFVTLFLFYLLGEAPVLNLLPESLAEIAQGLSLSAHFQSMARGVIDSRDVLYYLSVCAFFLFLNFLSLESRKWES